MRNENDKHHWTVEENSHFGIGKEIILWSFFFFYSSTINRKSEWRSDVSTIELFSKVWPILEKVNNCNLIAAKTNGKFDLTLKRS